MSVEDRLRKAFRAGHPEGPAPQRAWVAIQERIDRRHRRHRLAWWVAGLAPVVALLAGIPAYEALAPAGHPSRVVVTTPTPMPSAPASPTGSVTTVPVTPCPTQYGAAQSPIVPPASVTVSGVPAGTPIAAYGGPRVLLGPAGWHCQGLAAADGGLYLVVYPPGEATPPIGELDHGPYVQAITGYLPAPGNGPGKSLACGFLDAAKADAEAAGLPCSGIPLPDPGETRGAMLGRGGPAPGHGDGLDYRLQFENASPVSPGAYAYGLVFYTHATQAAGAVTCAVASDRQALCTPVLNDFRTRYGPPPPPACTGPQIRATNMASNGAGGTLMFGVRLTNVTLDPCRLAGYPSSLTGIRATGESVDLHPSDSLTNSNENTEGVLAPGRSGTVTLATTNACYGKQGLVIPGTFTALRIGLPGGGTVTVQGSYRFECGAMVSPLGVEPTL